ncbi:hypothetical protein [Polycladomyces subterraneus]|uniref:Uncharacterized protein n=1 Tax=Polycladomyces subterraneus TaxID=1016997 RepID=A0ABT8II05_9BACL|nr:hypothetical protein [Polycladomyces subterraneus]MDN4592415.1 hypothetical protein [Polycladomyces subterraneus]
MEIFHHSMLLGMGLFGIILPFITLITYVVVMISLWKIMRALQTAAAALERLAEQETGSRTDMQK